MANENPSSIPSLPFIRPDRKQFPFELIKLDEIPQKWAQCQPHRHDYYELWIIKSGHSVQSVDFVEYHLSDGDILYIPPGSVHQISAATVSEALIILAKQELFDVEQASLLRNHPGFLPLYASYKVTLPSGETEVWQTQLESLITLYEKEDYPSYKLLMQYQLVGLMLFIYQWIEQPKQPIDSNSLVLQFTKLLETSYRQEHSVQYYAEALSVSSRKLNQQLKAATGRGTQDWLIDRVILEARRELIYSDLSVKEVAFGLGFQDNFYFSRIFKRRIGQSPDRFRQEHKQ